MVSVYYIMKPSYGTSDDSTLAHRLLRHVLLRYHGITDAVLSKDDRGKPYLDGHGELHISITHTDSCVAVAVSDTPVGIDVETERAIRPRVMSKLFTEQEREYVGDDATRFTRIWTMKESFVKMTGEGITRRLGEADVLTGTNTKGAVFDFMPVPGTVMCVCTSCPNDKVLIEISETSLFLL